PLQLAEQLFAVAAGAALLLARVHERRRVPGGPAQSRGLIAELGEDGVLADAPPPVLAVPGVGLAAVHDGVPEGPRTVRIVANTGLHGGCAFPIIPRIGTFLCLFQVVQCIIQCIDLSCFTYLSFPARAPSTRARMPCNGTSSPLPPAGCP